jgi:hypothetical protein
MRGEFPTPYSLLTFAPVPTPSQQTGALTDDR